MMNIIDAVSDPNLFMPYLAGDSDDLSSWKCWLTFLRVLHGLKTSEEEADLILRATGRDPAKLSKSGYTECLVLAGRRSGKSKVIALVGAIEAVLSEREKVLSVGEIPMVAIISPTRFQSRIIHSYLKGIFESTPMLSNEVVEERRESFVLKNGVEVAIITGDPRSVRGFSVIAAIIDEIAMFGLSEESKVRSDQELVRAIRPTLGTTGGRLLCVGTPFKAAGYAYGTWKRAFGHDECDVLCWNAPSMLMNPTLPAVVVQRAIDEDSIAASVEYCVSPGLFREDVDGYVERAVVEGLVIPNRKELPPRSGVPYAAFADMSGGRHDDACLAIAHKEGQIIVLDCLERFPAPHDPHQVVAGMVMTLRRYGIDKILGDAYSAEWCRTTYQSHGITYNRASTSVYKEGSQVKNKIAKPKNILYMELLPRLTSGTVELLDDEVLISQLASLQRRTRSGGRDVVDHVQGAKDDAANCLAGVCDAVNFRRMVAGVTNSTSTIVGGAFGQQPTSVPSFGNAALDRAQEDLSYNQQRHEELRKGGYDYGGRAAEIEKMRSAFPRSPRLF